jgi:23S rRNA (uracil1939-C5)-methyltransferase
MALQKNHVIELTITALSSDGNGVGHHEGMAIFVPFTAVGDVGRVKLVKVCKSYAFGILEELLIASPERTDPQCAIYGKCGGCCFRHLTYTAELAAKERFVADAMQRLGGITLPVQPILPSPQVDRYRNKVQYPLYADANGTVRAGFYAGRSHRIIPCSDCLLQPVMLNQITQTVCALLTQYGISAYDEATHTGLVRHLYLRHSIVTDQVMVCLVCNGRKLPHAKDFCSALVQAHPQISGIVLNVNTRQTNVITGDECITLYGSSLLQDEMSGVPVALGPLSFYQVNTLGANQLYAAARRMAALNPQDVLLDLYCGAGTIGLSMAADCKQLIGVEIVPQAIESARRNAARMGVSHAQFICADAGQAARQLAKEGLRPDVIVLDPPRKGCDHPTLQAVLQMAPRRIVMVSCNPATAARDAQYLSAQGYPVTAIQPVDMFPRTKHVETVALLSRS